VLLNSALRYLSLLCFGLGCSKLLSGATGESRQAPGAPARAADASVAAPEASERSALPNAPPDGSAARTSGEPAPRPRAPRFPTEFQVVTMQGSSYRPSIRGNTLESLRAAHAQGVRYVEVDLFATVDDVLVTSHEAGIRECGDVRTMTSERVLACRLEHNLRVASLPQVLELPFAGIYLDLKETKEPEAAPRVVRIAAQAIVEAGREADVVVMVYSTPDQVLQTLRQHGLRAGMKGYPRNPDDTAELVRQAARVGFELVCVKSVYVTPELVGRAAELGVWLLPWSIDAGKLAHWQALAQAGIGGMIVLQYEVARKRVAPHWVSPTHFGRAEHPPAAQQAQ
jgi:glycerophosphoryl diester phosphodiesterase